eukprot:TRINITY_DN12388_c0_g1_i1.p1 TRINITY_DN12388_c0_g1~~TRINITY_DN12388_c0_g1_i1.p1  ORF type:complete len:113 (-),score=17.98 TRINITY_DN12388_c0_g1_i1:80-418(-)
MAAEQSYEGYAVKNGFNLAEFSFRQRQIICKKEAWHGGIRGTTWSLAATLLGMMGWAKKYGHPIRLPTKGMLMTMVGVFAFWSCAENAQGACRTRMAAARTADIIVDKDFHI